MLCVEDLRLGAEEEEGQGGDGRAVVYVNLAGSDLWFGKGKEGVRGERREGVRKGCERAAAECCMLGLCRVLHAQHIPSRGTQASPSRPSSDPY